ncbi:MAG: helix-hairpin-helix domain-containing protein [Erysipelothrix sp.]|nr:helix-hairpin-helix domain-containing protein [Erysipelothrix sp.]
MNPTIISGLASTLNIKISQVEQTLSLLQSGNTVAFIARYRKEATQGLDEEMIQTIAQSYDYEVQLIKRKEDVIRLINEQGLLSDELTQRILSCDKLSQVEEIYKPYKQKKLTKAALAIAAGLQPCAQAIKMAGSSTSLESICETYINEELTSVEQIYQMALDILVDETIHQVKWRHMLENDINKKGLLVSKLKKEGVDQEETYTLYHDYKQRLSYLQPYQIMALNRGEDQKILNINIDFDIDVFFDQTKHKFINYAHPTLHKDMITRCAESMKKNLFPSVVRSIRSDLTQKAQDHSIQVFANNVEQLLLVPPLKGKNILGWDPAYRTGCKLAVINEHGDCLAVDTVYPFDPKNDKEGTIKKLTSLIERFNISIIACGNGTASRESEQFLSEYIKTYPQYSLSYAMVSEAGASVYSASPLAKEEFPEFDVSLRSAISIARRLHDPLSELIKIDPRSVGVGQYQHDCPPQQLKEKVDFVVEKVVNKVGVDVNTASIHLISHISGLSKVLAKNIVLKRSELQGFKHRNQLKEVKGLGSKTFEQAIGFLRILDGEERLDATFIHPESYVIANKLLKSFPDLNPSQTQLQTWCQEHQTDNYTVMDILENLRAPERDYRDNFKGVQLRQDILKFEDVSLHDQFEGTVRNVVDFGAFVDIGLKNDGLIHKSMMNLESSQSVYHALKINDAVLVEVIGLDAQRQKCQLKLIQKVTLGAS